LIPRPSFLDRPGPPLEAASPDDRPVRCRSEAPPEFDTLVPGRVMTLTQVGRCMQALGRLEQQEGPQSELREHLAQSIALAPHLMSEMKPAQSADIDAIQQSLREGVLHRLPDAPARAAGIQLALDAVCHRLGATAAPLRGELAVPQVIAKPLPVESAVTIGHALTLPLRLELQGWEPGLVLASSDPDGLRPIGPMKRPMLRFVSDEAGITIELPPVSGATRSEQMACDCLLAMCRRALGKARTFKEALRLHNDCVPAGFRLTSLVNPRARLQQLTPVDAQPAAPVRSVWLDPALLAQHDNALDDLMSADPRSAALLSHARSTAAALESARRPCSSLPPPYRVDVVRGCLVQVLMELSCQAQQSPDTAAAHPPHWWFDITADQLLERLPAKEAAAVRRCREMLGRRVPAPPHAAPSGAAPQHNPLEWYITMHTAMPLACLRVRDPGIAEAPTPWAPPPRSAQRPNDASRRVVIMDDSDDAATGSEELESGIERRATVMEALDAAPASGRRLPGQWAPARFDALPALNVQPPWLSGAGQGDRSPGDAVIPSTTPPPDAPGPDAGLSLTTPETALAPAADAATTAIDYDRLITRVVKTIRRPGCWSSFAGELPPRLLVDCPGWPQGRALETLNLSNGFLLSSVGTTAPGRTPVVVALNLDVSHYMPMVDGVLLDVPSDGDCFYLSVLAAMGAADRDRLFEAMLLDPADALLPSNAVRALRQHFAAFLDVRRDAYRDAILALHAQIEPQPS